METKKYSNCSLIQHPIIEHKLTRLRDKATSAAEFRGIMADISRLMAYEIGREAHTKTIQVETPFETCSGLVIDEEYLLVSVMRAGNGMIGGLMQILPNSRVGHIGIYRDKTFNTTVEYYFRLPPNPEGKRVILTDPLVATGVSMVASIERLKEYRVGKIDVLCLLISPQALELLNQYHPDVRVTCISIERGVSDSGYLLPGIGDAGDRLYET